MAAVTQLVTNYLGGVSKQIDKVKLPGQVRECLNAYPDPTFGLRKRPGTKFIKNIHTSSDASSPDFVNAKWFFIKRDNEETYIGCILDSDVESTNPIKVWNSAGTACTVTYTGSAKDYIDTTRDNYSLLTVQDTTIITNKLKTVAAASAPTFVAKARGTVILKIVKYSTRYRIKLTVGSTDYTTADYITKNSADDAFTSGTAATQILNATQILTQLETNLNALSITGHVLTVQRLPASLELSLKTTGGVETAFTLEAIDDQGNTNMISYQDQIANVAELPYEAEHNRRFKVINSTSATDAYWVKFIANDGTRGPGYWLETVDPSVSTGMDASTLPHELKNTAANTFVFAEASWVARGSGDTLINPDPKFVGTTIQQVFFHNNRLGILTEDNVAMSQAGDFYNFYLTSAIATSEADPIGVNCSSIRPAVLHSVIPTAQGLILFSKNQQFIMFADAGILTPTTSIIRGISNYEMDANIDPVEVGTGINFISKTPSYSRVFSMSTRGQNESPLVQDIGKVVSEWIPDTVTNLVSSPQNSIIALYGDNTSPYEGSSSAYFHKTYTVGDKILLQSWFQWALPVNIQRLSIDSDILWSIIEYNGKYILCNASLTQTPEEKIIVNSEGQQVNPHMDLYGAISSMTYDATNKLTKCYLPTGMRDNSTLTPVLVVTGDGTTNFAGVTESGFTITPDRPTGQTHATSSPYFEVPGEDLTNLSASDIIVGYKYNYDIELPRTYYKLNQEGTTQDYTAALIVSRMKFAVGLSSVCGFKVKSKGRQTPKEEYTGLGSTFSSTLVANGTGAGPEGDHTVENVATTTSGSGTGMTVDVTMSGGVATAVSVNTEGTGYAASDTVTIAKTLIGNTTANVTATLATIGQTDFPFNIDYEDVTELKVKVNGVANTGFSIVNDADRGQKKLLRFTTPPGEGDTILLYTNNWYTIQPVQDANQYLADDIPLTEDKVFTIPIHQRSENFNIRVFSNSPFPVSLTSMMWEGQYSPRFYRRT